MKIEVVSRKLIKPHIPTPPNLKTHKISFLDELAPSSNIGFLLFYPSKPQEDMTKLEESLANILTEFYPFAGRYIKSDHIIDCSDQGVELLEAEAVDHDLVNAIGKAEHLNYFLPRLSHFVDMPIDPILSIQITRFKCGGTSIGVSITHRICDGTTLKTFLAAWSSASNQSHSQYQQKVGIIPTFTEGPMFFPGRNWNNPNPGPSRLEDHGVVVKRLCFDKEAISKLKSKLRPKDGKLGFSKVLVVSAVIAKTLIRLDRAKYGKSRNYLINQAVDMRRKTVPPLGEHACGNLVLQALSSCVPVSRDATADVELQVLVDLMSVAIAKSNSDGAKILAGGVDGFNDIVLKRVKEELPRILSGEMHVLWFSDCSKNGYYEANFGSGKPLWASTTPLHSPNTTFLMNTAGGDGIEALVHLLNSDIHLFEQVQHINLSKL